ncbi:MAG: hypothetical protein PHW01_01785 [Patescibacteria group bacterium]|nr:hypothetical protein [Patescibacteria group bacterium]
MEPKCRPSFSANTFIFNTSVLHSGSTACPPSLAPARNDCVLRCRARLQALAGGPLASLGDYGANRYLPA